MFLPKAAAGIQAEGVWAGLGHMLLCKAEAHREQHNQQHRYSWSLLKEVPGAAALSVY